MKRSKKKAKGFLREIPWLLPWLSGRPLVAPRRDPLDEYIETEKIKFLPWLLPWLSDDESDPAWVARRDDEYIETEEDRIETEEDREWGRGVRERLKKAQRGSVAARNADPRKELILKAFDEIHAKNQKLGRRAIAKQLVTKIPKQLAAKFPLLNAEKLAAKFPPLTTNAIDHILRRGHRS